MHRLLLLSCALSVLAAVEVRADESARPKSPSADDADFFETRVRPLLANNCFECHGEKKQEAGLRLDVRKAAMRGGDEGPVIKPGSPESSKLIAAVGYAGDIQMPPRGKMPAEQIEILAAWVKRGAPWPEHAAVNEASNNAIDIAKTHWAFQPVHEPPAPPVSQVDWIRGPVDAYVLARLEAVGIAPGNPADKRTIIRRATIDLTGLPPTPAEIDDFLNDESPEAFAKVVDRLLASPRYGERWGRYWLDLARYADTKGYVFNEDRNYPFAHVYRDWVIRAFNEDLPYDQFLVQQLAADRIPHEGERNPGLAAMGFLTLGRRFLNNKLDIIDDRIDVTMRGMMGLTVSCARCHDHKFDPIPAADYYSLFGVFDASVEKLEPVAPASEDYLKGVRERETKIEQFLNDRRPEIEDKARGAVQYWLLAAALGQEELAKKNITFKIFDEAFGNRQNRRFIERWKSYLDEARKQAHPVVAPWIELAALPEAEFEAKAAEVTARLRRNEGSAINPLVAAQFSDSPKTLVEAASKYGELFQKINDEWKQKLEAAKKSNGPAPTALDDPAAEQIRQVLFASDSPVVIPPQDTEQYLDRKSREQFRGLRTELTKWASSPGAPLQAMTMQDAPNVSRNPRILLRGNPGRPGDEVPRRFLSIVAGQDRQPFKDGSGRLELAQAIASAQNPLTARVLVNRVWLNHFGQGLVNTPSDFGVRSDVPSHPELLDYLAARFMAEGWSIKNLHRWIMLSNTYQQSSEDRSEARAKDPENRLLWRMNRRRMDLEAMRDSLLFVAGTLDETRGGPAVNINGPQYSKRRTIYGQVERQNLPAMFRTFDFATPDAHSPQRFTTTIPQQALFLLNSPFVLEQAAAVVGRPEIASAIDATDRIRRLYPLLLGRSPSDEEVSAGVQFVSSGSAEANWRQYAQALIVSNEFVFID
jgi:hypothetical protein